MKNRIIGGVVFVVLFYLSILLNFFNVLGLLFLVIGLYEISRAVKTTDKSKRLYSFLYALVYVIGIISMFVIYKSNNGHLAYLITLVMLNDTFAYFVGKSIGKTHFSSISPNKTIEGAIGGIVVSFVFYFIIMTVFNINGILSGSLLVVFIKYFVLMIVAIVGDLAESLLKRNANIKDSGKIVYGHGGILDRIDSWVFASIILLLIR